MTESRLGGALRIASRPAHWRVVVRDLLHRREPLCDDAVHLRAAIEWLGRAQEAGGGGGLSAGYSFRRGWLPPYPETTGYTIPTWLRFAQGGGAPAWAARAEDAGDWEIDIQLPEGGVRGGQGINEEPVVFNTGQVILGWCALYRHTGHGRYVEAAARAADWLLSVQGEDGAWRRHTYRDVSHAYHSRVAWALLEAAEATGEPRYRRAAEANVRWVAAAARRNGWIDGMSFRPGEAAFTHTIAYTYRGLLECSQRLDGDVGTTAARLARQGGERLLRRFELNKPHYHADPHPLAATLDHRWRPVDESASCVSGNAQIALLWLRLAAEAGADRAMAWRWTNSACKMLDQVKATQSLGSSHAGIRGAVPGSLPVWGWYLRLAYPNWAAKFLADALMELDEVFTGLEAGL